MLYILKKNNGYCVCQTKKNLPGVIANTGEILVSDDEVNGLASTSVVHPSASASATEDEQKDDPQAAVVAPVTTSVVHSSASATEDE